MATDTGIPFAKAAENVPSICYPRESGNKDMVSFLVRIPRHLVPEGDRSKLDDLRRELEGFNTFLNPTKELPGEKHYCYFLEMHPMCSMEEKLSVEEELRAILIKHFGVEVVVAQCQNCFVMRQITAVVVGIARPQCP